MKKILSFAAAMILCMVTTASAQAFKSGDHLVSGLVGLSDRYGMPVGLTYEVGVSDLSETSSIGIGAYLGGAFDDATFEVGTYTYHSFTAAATANYHYTGVRNLDLYGGVRLGYNYTHGKTNWQDPDFALILGDQLAAKDKSEVAYDVHFGARYYLLRRVAIFTEVGYGISIVSGGLTYKF